ncbi:hypothetical protein BDV24DRAFT_163971 [Aspergillus arachidicola]|uniref:3-ketoacyl-CoA thiolase n=1 Tax=Aspergillus arachidicola TaxID=656916 RepID=A0A5N6Y5M1_9EURO|nr:hypothetical protein BDV24DRAFT_163971 [Aspergillus arachidicola]
MAAQRLDAVVAQLSPSKAHLESIVAKHPDDIVITLAVRTAFTKARKGGFNDTSLDHLSYSLLKQVIERSRIDPALINDICFANCWDPQAVNKSRAAMLAAGFPYTSTASAVNRFCASGLKAVQDIANQIREGSIEIGVALGVELMPQGPAGDCGLSEEVLRNVDAVDCLQPMIQTSENVARDFNISRLAQHQYAAESFRRAEIAKRPTGQLETITIIKDEGPRYGTTVEALSKLRPALPQFGDTTTAGNASQTTDGAAAVLLMKRSKALQLGQPILGKFVGATVAGVPPRIMGIGPTAAIPRILSRFGLGTNDIDLYEINEAFASMAVYCVESLGLDRQKLNPRGGAIALGHPLAATGTRQIVTALSEARRTKKRVLLTSMCVGSGQGMASLVVNEQL